MLEKIPKNNSDKREALEDNARKFIVEAVDGLFLQENDAKSFVLVVDWLETDEDAEKKVAYKQFDNGDTQILLITKTTNDGSRTSVKEPISADDYARLATLSVLHLEKRRYEFDYAQADTTFSLKYDEYSSGKFCVLEVDGADDKTRHLFDPSSFPATLDEVTGDLRFYGYRIADVVKEL